MLSSFKSFLKKSPVPFSKNHRYDILTKKIIRHHCNTNSNCVDVGAHRGEVLDWFLKYAPQGIHYAFEPIPFLFDHLKNKYATKTNCRLYDLALSNTKEVVPFNYVITNPAYSGLRKRKYDRSNEKDTIIQVQTDLLDDIVAQNSVIDFIKIDVEGAELNVLNGAKQILANNHPVVVFEFGIGGSDIYGSTPEKLFSFFQQFNYKVFLLEKFIKKEAALSLEELKDQFYNKRNYYFVAY